MQDEKVYRDFVIRRAQDSHRAVFSGLIEDILKVRGGRTALELKDALYRWTTIPLKQETVDGFLDAMVEEGRLRKSMFNYYLKGETP